MNNDLSIHSLHNDILRKLPFTVSGNASIEKTVYKFLQEVAESPFLVSNRRIAFLMGGFAKIKLDDLSELFEHKWETRRLRSFFFYDYDDDHVEPILSLYRYSLELLTQYDANGVSKFRNVTNIICDNNHAGVNFRVRIIDADTSKKIKVTHVRRERVLEAQIPVGFYNKEFKRFHLSEKLNGTKTCVERSRDNPYQYFNSPGFEDCDKSEYDFVLSELLGDCSPDKFRDGYNDFVLNAEENSTRFSESVLKHRGAEIKEIYYLFYIAGLLAYLLDCDIEYFTSVSNNFGENKKYSLGSIAVGYRREAGGQLSSDVRAFFNIVSNHIAQNLATQILLDSSRMQHYITKRKEQEQFIKDFADGFLNGEWLHCGRKNSESAPFVLENKAIVEVDGTITVNGNQYKAAEINNSFGTGFIQYLNRVLGFDRIDYGLFQGFHGAAAVSCCRQLNKFYEYFENPDGWQLGLKLTERQIDPTGDSGEIGKPGANVYLPHLLISLIEKNSEDDEKMRVSKITTKTVGASAEILVEYENPVSINNLIRSLDGTTEQGGSFQQFIKDHYDAFRICGDFLIKDSDGKFAISFREDFKTAIDEHGQVKFTFVGNPNPIIDTQKLTLEIKYNLFK